MKELYKENLWNKIHEEINSLKNDESMKGFFKKNVLDFDNLTDSITYIISNKLISDDMSESNFIFNIREAFLDDGKWKIVNNKFVFKQHDTVSSTTDSGDVSFGQVLSANKNNTILLVGQQAGRKRKCFYHKRKLQNTTH